MAGGGFGEASGEGFFFAAKPAFPDVFFDNSEVILGATGNVELPIS